MTTSRYHEGRVHGAWDGICATNIHGYDEANPQSDDPGYVDGYIEGFGQGQLWRVQERQRQRSDAFLAALGIPALARWLDRGVRWVSQWRSR